MTKLHDCLFNIGRARVSKRQIVDIFEQSERVRLSTFYLKLTRRKKGALKDTAVIGLGRGG